MIDVSESPSYGKTLRTFEVSPEMIDEIYRFGNVALPDEFIWYDAPRSEETLWPNQSVVLKCGSQSALARVSPAGDDLITIEGDLSFYKIQPRNKEQKFLFDLLCDPEVRCLVVTGAAGTGKSTAIGSFSLDAVMGTASSHSKMILSKPLEIVTKTRFWGTVPGDENDKFGPFLKSFSIMFENMIGKNGSQYVEMAIKNKTIEFMPLELMRGATLRQAIVWYDEAQNLNAHECATLGTRIDDVGNSKLILSGDLSQRDRNLSREFTGLHKLCTNPHFLKSPLTAHVDLKVIERGKIAQLFHDVFDDDLNSKG